MIPGLTLDPMSFLLAQVALVANRRGCLSFGSARGRFTSILQLSLLFCRGIYHVHLLGMCELSVSGLYSTVAVFFAVGIRKYWCGP
jgi:hypothetical protein